ncbi:hypothetical protein ACF08N_25475 [Streptomyces sp. NPDC015127]|uniref:hypothetical protein n=1 Tax=Streptomyces sp. NPDC015127 TaxID=3364939 RepID=UPI0036F89C78
MRRTILALTALATVSVGAPPASAASVSTDRAAWEPAPSAPWDVAAGVRCDVAVQGEPIVDEVVRRVTARHPDGSPKQVAYKGDLVVRVTNTVSGAFYDADVSGSALVDHRTDGSQFWTVRGPVLVGVGEGRGNLPRGLYVVDGVYTMDISADGYKSVNLAHGSLTDICDRID